jgi:signal transduction histidine kinase
MTSSIVSQARTRRETHVEAARVLAEAPNVLASSLDYEETLAAVAELAVRSLADYCIIDVLENGELVRLKAAHSDPAMARVTEGFLRFPLDRRRGHPSLAAIDSRQPVLIASVTAGLLDSLASCEEHRALIDRVRPRSLMAIPLLAREHVLGVVLMASVRRSFDRTDLELAEKLVRLGALEVDNARLYREAQRALQARDRVLGIVAHDLRNPLNVISMCGELLLDDCLPEAKRADQVHLILRASKRMNRLIQDLLDVARIEADRLSLRREQLDAARIAHEAVEMNASLAAARSLTLKCGMCEPRAPIFADHDRIIQVLSNLIGNAIKYTPEGGAIEVRVVSIEDGAQISVSDTGPGIGPENLSRLFQPFWQSQPGSLDGAGLGLTIARGIVEAHGGTIRAESVPGLGSTFHFTVPAREEEPAGERRHGPSDRRTIARMDGETLVM